MFNLRETNQNFDIMIIEDWGEIRYKEAWDKQVVLFDALVKAKQNGTGYDNRIIFCEHPHVYTLGKNGKDQNMLINEQRMAMIGAELFHIDRGGDITYHGPGQQVCYPILNLADLNMGIKEYIHALEQIVINVCAAYGVAAERLDGAIGVWLDVGKPTARKICAIGVKCSHFITMHGLAFNINTDLTYFNHINPCGFVDKGVTSLAKELGHEVSMEEVKLKMVKEMKIFNNQH